MAHSHWFILCGLSSASVPSQSRSNPPTDPAPRPSDWCLRGVENYAASISISHHLLKLQLIQLHLAPSALLSSNSLKLQPMLCACYVVQCACSAMSVDKDFSSLSDVTWYNAHVLWSVLPKIFHPWVMLHGTMCMFCVVTIVHVLWLARTQTCLVIRTHVTIVCNRNKWAHKADLPQTTTNQLLYHQGHTLIISVLDLGRSFQKRFKENGKKGKCGTFSYDERGKGVPIHTRKPN